MADGIDAAVLVVELLAVAWLVFFAMQFRRRWRHWRDIRRTFRHPAAFRVLWVVLGLAAVAPRARAADDVLVMSQVFLTGAGAGRMAVYSTRIQHPPEAGAAGLGVVVLSVVLERAYDRKLSKRTKLWLTIANFAGGAALCGYMGSDIKAARDIDRARAGLAF